MTNPPWHNTHNAIAGLHFVRTRKRLGKDEDETVFHELDYALQEIARYAHFSSPDGAGRERWRAHKRDGGLTLIVDPRGSGGRRLPKLIWVGQGKPPRDVWTP